MRFVYTRLGNAPAIGLQGEGALDAGWLGGASACGLPRRAAWVARGKRGDASDIWRDLGFSAPAQGMPATPAQDGQSYILQQDRDGRWLVDHWHGDANALRPASTAATAGVPAEPVSTCFIIELGHATQR
ncbi:hypothetical protein [Massilia sp. DWR3-1-1]|uniref:hypothetical protein n=1 Tax=Massilia sp. DWR3-1-1 TaxID=2804559 RepID=UPI003CEB7327